MSIANPAGAGIPLSNQDDKLSARLVEARLNAEQLPRFPGALPETLEQAYGIQAASVSRWPDRVAGWKVARLPVNDRDRFGAERLAGPVFESAIREASTGSETIMPVFDGGFAAIEAEIILELGVDVAPAAEDRAEQDLADLVCGAFCGAEIASSPMPFVIDLGAMAIIPDLGINAGVVVGPEIADFRSVPGEALTTRVVVDGVAVGEASPGPIVAKPFEALRFLLDHCASHGIKLPKGTLVSTGMITGVHDVRVGSIARVDFGSTGWFEVTFEPVSGR